MSNAPIITFRTATSPYNSYSQSLIYSETVALYPSLPVLSGDKSDTIVLRIYNNFGTPPSSNIASAYNFQITTYDSGAVQTASTPPVSNMWIYFQENAYGEQSIIPGLVNTSQGTAKAVGGNANIMSPEVGTDGSSIAQIRAGTNKNGVGFIEFNTYAGVPLTMSTHTWNFAIGVIYNWNT